MSVDSAPRRIAEHLFRRDMVGPSFGNVATSVVGLLLIEKLTFQFMLPYFASSMETSMASMGRTKALYLGGYAAGLLQWVGIGTLMALPAMFKVKAWKIQPNKELDWAMLRRSMPLIVFNFFLAQTLTPMVFLQFLPESAWDMRSIPSTSTLLRDIVVWLAVEEIVFFNLHRWMHENKTMYKKIHKLHHIWTAPISYAAIYCHPLEHILCNIFPFILGPLLCGSHVMAAATYIFAGTIHTMGVHSGFWICDDNGMHDEHHRQFSCNYGVLGVCDELYGSLRLPPGATGEKAEAAKSH